MIEVLRSLPTPAAVLAVLQRARRCGRTELEVARAYYTTLPRPSAAFDFDAYSKYEVCLELDRIFRGKCAYCEASYQAVSARNVDHYRPKGAVAEDPSHPGYWWLAAEWTNLLPSCLACNQRRRQVQFQQGMTLAQLEQALQVQPSATYGKGDSFPTADAKWVDAEDGDLLIEDPLLIDPCTRNPADHLEWSFDFDASQNIWEADPLIPFLQGRQMNAGSRDSYGETSVAIYGLNRAGLIKDRMDTLRKMQLASVPIVDAVDDLSQIADQTSAAALKLIARLARYKAALLAYSRPSSPFSAMARAYIDAFEAVLFATAP
ncbi:hypothetical protein [Comamonas testosteroni]|uniref:hypothetical protein n=1 Tax=Comamonas testosteroni TaxID=285 RepID=UPI0026EAC8A8|nr:hypothetical protein [Comamonas testosteroni]